MDQTSIAHALRELNELEAFTYVPPFRGRAIRMIRRDLPFEELEIDFEALERRKAAEYEKLNRVVRFALSGACRQREILRYFGETNAAAMRPLRQLPRSGTAEAAGARPAAAARPCGRRRRRSRQRARGGADGPQRRRPHPGPLPLRQEPDRPDALRLGQRQDDEAAAGQAEHVRPAEASEADRGAADDRRPDRPGCLEQVELDSFGPWCS